MSTPAQQNNTTTTSADRPAPSCPTAWGNAAQWNAPFPPPPYQTARTTIPTRIPQPAQTHYNSTSTEGPAFPHATPFTSHRSGPPGITMPQSSLPSSGSFAHAHHLNLNDCTFIDNSGRFPVILQPPMDMTQTMVIMHEAGRTAPLHAAQLELKGINLNNWGAWHIVAAAAIGGMVGWIARSYSQS